MDIAISNTDHQVIAVVDVFESFIWIERYNGFGNFELYTEVTPYLLSIFVQDYYVQIPDSEYTMIIESLEIQTHSETGKKLIVRGRSLESILDRRVVWTQTLVDSNIDGALNQVISDAFITGVSNPTLRPVPGFSYISSTDPNITSILIERQLDAENIYDLVDSLCKENGVGFKLTFNSSFGLDFMLYKGLDRSFGQSTNRFVVFSPRFDNLISSTYFQSKMNFKNATLWIGDESETTALVRGNRQIPGHETSSGLARREVVTNLSHLSRFIQGTGTPIDPNEYTAQARQAAIQNLLINYKEYSSFEGRADTSNSWKYRTDFFLGDIVQIENEYGMSGTARITEITFSENVSGIYTYPTFETL